MEKITFFGQEIPSSGFRLADMRTLEPGLRTACEAEQLAALIAAREQKAALGERYLRRFAGRFSPEKCRLLAGHTVRTRESIAEMREQLAVLQALPASGDTCCGVGRARGRAGADAPAGDGTGVPVVNGAGTGGNCGVVRNDRIIGLRVTGGKGAAVDGVAGDVAGTRVGVGVDAIPSGSAASLKPVLPFGPAVGCGKEGRV